MSIHPAPTLTQYSPNHPAASTSWILEATNETKHPTDSFLFLSSVALRSSQRLLASSQPRSSSLDPGLPSLSLEFLCLPLPIPTCLHYLLSLSRHPRFHLHTQYTPQTPTSAHSTGDCFLPTSFSGCLSVFSVFSTQY